VAWPTGTRAKKAIADFTDAIRLKPEDAVNYANRGRCYVETSEQARAEADFARARELEIAHEEEPIGEEQALARVRRLREESGRTE
jgi:Flp pilus assembly protein TadD